MAQKIVFLMYHELEQSGRPLCRTEPGYVRYVVGASDFELQMRWLHSAGWRATNVTEALTFPHQPTVALTFDDGCASDLLIAAPVLRELGFGATSYITVAWLNSPGFLSTVQLRELSQSGVEIGSHSMTHPYLSDLDDQTLEREMLESKQRLEDLIRRPVIHFSCPGGRYDQRVQATARQLGYQSVTTSQPLANSRLTSSYTLGRVVIMRNTRLTGFQRICHNQGLWRLRAIETARASAKHLLGNTCYDRLRAALLGRKLRHQQSTS
jgi:peptidoglycan/xylan/chitin deacetylase (PgdA/CDA1 family)